MIDKRLSITFGLLLWVAVSLTAKAEIGKNTVATAEAAYQQYIAAIHRASKPDELPAFAHTSPLNKIKLADDRSEEKEIMAALKELTPHTVQLEGRVDLGNRSYLFFDGDPDKAAQAKEYFPVTAEMVKEEGHWRLRRQQSWHVKDGSPESMVIAKGAARIKRFQELVSAISQPIANHPVSGTMDGKPFRPKTVYFKPREGYFKLTFVDGKEEFSVYVRDPSSYAEVQKQTFVVNPLDGYECDLSPEEILLGPYGAKLQFGTVTHGVMPATISLAVRTPIAVNLNGVFFAQENEDTFSPDKEDVKNRK